MKLGFKADVGDEEQEDNNETKDVRTRWVLDSFPITTTKNYQKLHVIKRQISSRTVVETMSPESFC